MIKIFEKFVEDSFIECSEEEAEYIHYCFNNDNLPCRREKILTE